MKASDLGAAATASPLSSEELDGGSTPVRRRILSISPFEEDHAALGRILHEMKVPFRFTAARTCEEAAARLSREPFGTVVCEGSLPDGTWGDILNQICDAAETLLIVTSRLADEQLWAEVLNLGGYDVLAKPFRDQEVQYVLTSALGQKENSVPRTRTAGAA